MSNSFIQPSGVAPHTQVAEPIMRFEFTYRSNEKVKSMAARALEYFSSIHELLFNAHPFLYLWRAVGREVGR